MHLQAVGSLTTRGGPPAKTPAGKSFRRDPEALAVKREDTDRGASPVSEDEESPQEWIDLEDLSALLGEPIDSFPEVDELNRQEDLHLGSDLDHRSRLQKDSIRATMSTVAPPASRIVIFAPPGLCTSTVEPGEGKDGRGSSSTKAGGARRFFFEP